MSFRSPLSLLILAACSGPAPLPVDPTVPEPTGIPDPVPDPVRIWDQDLSITQIDVRPIFAGVQTCEDPSLRDVAPFVETRYETHGCSTPWIWGGGLLVADLDDDGALDIWVTDEAGISAFTVVDTGLVATASPGGTTTGGAGGAIADYDGDGDLDVFVTRWEGWPGPVGPTEGQNKLFRNDGPAGYTDVTEAAGGLDGCVEGDCVRTVAASFGDYDRDGDLDLFVGSHGFLDPNVPGSERGPGDATFLYDNNGDGTFTDVSATLPVPLQRSYTLAGGFMDLDDDGWLDLYSTNDIGHVQPNVVMWNHEGQLEIDPKEDSGLTIATSCMGLGIGDLNGDQRPDLVVPAWNNMLFLESFASIDVWVNTALTSGLFVEGEEKIAWGSDVFDADNDGDLDVITQAGWLDPKGNPNWASPRYQPDQFWINEGTPTDPMFVESAAAWGLDDDETTRGVAAVDLNRDGTLDLLKHNLTGTLIASLSNCGAEAWLRVVLEQPGTLNPDAIGAKIVIASGDQTYTRWITAGGSSIGVSLPPEAHFGLGMVDEVDRIEVRWPDGSISQTTDVLTRQEVRFVREP